MQELENKCGEINAMQCEINARTDSSRMQELMNKFGEINAMQCEINARTSDCIDQCIALISHRIDQPAAAEKKAAKKKKESCKESC